MKEGDVVRVVKVATRFRIAKGELYVIDGNAGLVYPNDSETEGVRLKGVGGVYFKWRFEIVQEL